MASMPVDSSPIEQETHKGDSIFQVLQYVFGSTGQHANMDVEKGDCVEENERGSFEQSVKGCDLERKRFEKLIEDANVELYPESNVCKNLINALLDVDKKSKDNLKSHLDLKDMKIR
ncbi:hypothetical protein Ancab_035567 [Ancistrocladus abbreviatus]